MIVTVVVVVILFSQIKLIIRRRRKKMVFPEYITLLKGIVHHASNHGDDYYGFDFRKSEMNDVSKALRRPGVSVLLEHDRKLGSIGNVVSARIRPVEDDLEVILAIDRRSKTGKETIDRMLKGELQGLSLGCLPDDEADLWGVCEKLRIDEVSICPIGGRPDCFISKFNVKDKMYLLKSIHTLTKEERSQTDFSKKLQTITNNNNNNNFLNNNNKEKLFNINKMASNSRVDMSAPAPIDPAPINASGNNIGENSQKAVIDVNTRLENISKRARLSPEAILAQLESVASQAEQEEAAEQERINNEYQRICQENATNLPFNQEELNGVDFAARYVIAAMDGNYQSREAARKQQEENVKVMAKNVQAENEQLKQQLQQAQADLEKERSLKRPAAFVNKALGATTTTNTFYQQPDTNTRMSVVQPHIPQNIPVNASGQPRVAGLVIEQQPPSCFDTGYGTPNPKFSFQNLLQKAYSNSDKFKGLEKGPTTGVKKEVPQQ